MVKNMECYEGYAELKPTAHCTSNMSSLNWVWLVWLGYYNSTSLRKILLHHSLQSQLTSVLKLQYWNGIKLYTNINSLSVHNNTWPLTCSSNEMTLGCTFSRMKWHTACATSLSKEPIWPHNSDNICLDITRLIFSFTTATELIFSAMVRHLSAGVLWYSLYTTISDALWAIMRGSNLSVQYKSN